MTDLPGAEKQSTHSDHSRTFLMDYLALWPPLPALQHWKFAGGSLEREGRLDR